MIIYSIVVPVFNEELIIQKTYDELKAVMDKTNKPYEIIFVNDGSSDSSPKIIESICNNDKNIRLINFSRNFGHQMAITAGMDYSKGKAIIVIDADLQDPPAVILDMIKKWEEGFLVVYGKRKKRLGDSFFKKVTAHMFYKFLNSQTSIDMPRDVGDFRLIDRIVLEELKKLPEHNRYLRGLIPWLGFKQTSVSFVRNAREAGVTKYPLKKMLKLALDGIVSFSSKPLKLATYIGSITCLSGLIYFIFLIGKVLLISNIPIYYFIIPVVLFLSGIVLMSLGIIGEYISRIYDEVKNRPLYIIKDIINKAD